MPLAIAFRASTSSVDKAIQVDSILCNINVDILEFNSDLNSRTYSTNIKVAVRS